ncbi:hypothetical protein AB0F68_14870 [Micromonospora sp. NPDC023966]|uniref:hypothetical protein n=1 Tax=Micromonospora sp. NPDC023966 TaxID=3154699 RepID=UPI00340B603F
MSVRRHAARWATVGAMLGGLVVGAASPALAADDRVEVRSASSFTAGGSAGTVAVEVRKRTDGCVLLRTALGLRLDGLRADQVRVQVATGGRWVAVPVSGGGGAVATAQTSPANAALCKGKGITVRYRVAFLAGTIGGRLAVAGEASAANGRVLGRSATAARVVGAQRTASPSPTPSRKPSPTPTPSAVATTPAEADTTAVAAALDPAAGAAADDSSSGGSPIMWFGIALVLVGVALIVLLVRRSRAEKTDGQPGVGQPPVPLPRSSTTYRSGAPAGQVYGQQAAAPTPRPSGSVYGASAATADGPDGEPPAAAGGDATTVLPRVPR